jgi:hypothetical protein
LFDLGACDSTAVPPLNASVARQCLTACLEHSDRAGRVARHQPPADVKCGGVENPPAFGYSQFGGAAADVDV